MPTTTNGEITLYFEQFGRVGDPTVLMVSGLGAQCVAFDDELCEMIASRGRHVVRFDNRDVGLSSHLADADVDVGAAVMAAMSGDAVDAPYTLSDMAGDAVAVLDALEVDAAHVVGTSMGGMIAQTVAIEHRERVRSLTSIMSNTGEPGYGDSDPEVLGAILAVMGPRETREERVVANVELSRAIGTRERFDEERARRRAELVVDRAYDPVGVTRQFMAILASGPRADGLRALQLPTTVMHGDEDRLVRICGGRRTAELVGGSTFVELRGMAHDLPPRYWSEVNNALDGLMGRSEKDGDEWAR